MTTYIRWTWRIPLDEQWAAHPAHVDMLRFWIRAAETDDWTYSQLQELLRCLMDAGSEIPEDLTAWGLEVAAERRTRPTRRGPKSDMDRDMRIAAGEHILMTLGKSQRQADHIIGEALNLDPLSVYRAARRAQALYCYMIPPETVQ